MAAGVNCRGRAWQTPLYPLCDDAISAVRDAVPRRGAWARIHSHADQPTVSSQKADDAEDKRTEQ